MSMSKSTERRIRVMEDLVAPVSPQRVLIIIEYPDGSITIPGGEEAPKPGEDCHIIRAVGVEAHEGRALTEDDLEAKYPGRRERLAQWDDTLSRPTA